jgi:probable rRNA maturation factor
MGNFTIEIANRQNLHAVDVPRLCRAAETVLGEAALDSAELSIAVVDDPTIHALNLEFLAHDYPTDVLSFVLEHAGGRLEGEIIVSAQTAARAAATFGWSAEDELLLYVVHGALHLIGYDDGTDADRARMREAERRILTQFDVRPRDTAVADVSAGERV